MRRSPKNSTRRDRAPTPITVSVPVQEAPSPQNKKKKSVAPMSPSLGDLLDLKDQVGLHTSSSSPVSPSIRRASMASARSKMKKSKSFKDFDPFEDLFPAGNDNITSSVKDPFSSSPVRKIPISPRVRRASAASKGRKSSFKDLVVPTTDSTQGRKSSFKDLVVSTTDSIQGRKSSFEDLVVATTENVPSKENQEFDPFADLFPTKKSVMAVSPRVRRASMNAFSRRQQEEDEEEEEDDDDGDSQPGGVSLSPRTRTRNEYYRARQDYKIKKRLFYRNKNSVDTPRRRSMQKEALDAKRILENAFDLMSIHNVENRDEFHDDFDVQGL